MKKLILIVPIILFNLSLYSQQAKQEVYEPAKIKVAKKYNTPEKLTVDVLISDSRAASKSYSDNIKRIIANYIKESYPKTKINLTKNVRAYYKPEPNKVLVRIDIVDYFVVKRNKKWLAKSTLDIIVLDLRNNKIKQYKERVSHNVTQVNRNGTQSAKMALNNSFKVTIVKSVDFIENSIRGNGKYELARTIPQNNLNEKPIIAEQADEQSVKPEAKEKVFTSDVDINIPTSPIKYPNRFALIIGNEDYISYQTGLANEVNVEFAERDAKTFKQYAEKTLGIPDENIILIINARVVEFSKSIEKMNSIAKHLDGEAEIFFYYAGHGFPDENTKEPYLIPVDVNGTSLEFAISLNEAYKKLTEYPTRRVTVFLDACFSGGARNQGLLSARGVKVQPKENILNGNLVVFTASSGTQSSLPFKEQQHGLFTYYLLKKLQETNGEVLMPELGDYLKKQVSVKSVMINGKEQIPQINISPGINEIWEKWTIN